jgi:hypothetical protein
VRQSAPIDDLDDLPAPRPLPLLRPCGRKGCRRFCRPGGRYCRPCATAATRRWRDRHRGELEERERARAFSREERAIRAARAYVAQYLKRGKLGKTPCGICGEREVLAAWNDPKRPLEVHWLCRQHYEDHREAQRDAAVARRGLAAEWARVRDELTLLPPAIRAEVHAAALQGPVGHGCPAGSTLYWWTLRRELARCHEGQVGRALDAPAKTTAG